MTEAHDQGDCRWASPLRFMTVIAVACVLRLVAMQDASASDANARPGTVAGNTTIQSFSKAKKLMRQVFAGHERTFYCDCAYDGTTVDVQSCGYQPHKPSKRARQLEWEHVVPAEAFGQSFPEWRDGHPECVDRRGKAFRGRNCAAKMAIPFRYMEADLYNLQPAIGEVNQLRSNYSMAMIDGEARRFGPCDLEIEDRKVEPRPDIRGDIARTYFYMDAAYPGRGVISDKNRKLFEAWAREDPVDAWERERVGRIARLQGNTNPFVQ
jgi:deoxyribonuclease-1